MTKSDSVFGTVTSERLVGLRIMEVITKSELNIASTLYNRWSEIFIRTKDDQVFSLQQLFQTMLLTREKIAGADSSAMVSFELVDEGGASIFQF